MSHPPVTDAIVLSSKPQARRPRIVGALGRLNGFGSWALLALAIPLMSCSATPPERRYEYTLGASGTNNNDFDAGGFRANGSAGIYLNDLTLVGLRQDVSHFDAEGQSSVTNGSTRAFIQQHFSDNRLRPFIGANFGFVYGDSVEDTAAAAPEVGLKYSVSDSAFLFLLGEYQFFFEDADEADNAFDDGQFVYTVGIGLRF